MFRPPRDARALRAGHVWQTMNPSRQSKKKPINLYRLVHKQSRLMEAWHHVEKRVEVSKDLETQRSLASFRKDPENSIADIGRKIRKTEFIFEPQRGYAKARRGKTPRPIVVAPIVNRIVQRTILDICQEEDPSVRYALGDLPSVIDCPTSLGGLPDRGVQNAVAQIQTAIKNGAKWYVRSDLKNFFTKIPKPKIEEFLRTNIVDDAFVNLFMKALETELSNEDDVRKDLDLFPTGDLGVPQGSALSALCANIILAEFDLKLNGRGITTIRYLDDFVILAPSRKAVEKAWSQALRLLASAGLEAHDPDAGTGKASRGEIEKGFDFLSFHIKGATAAPSTEALQKFLDGISALIREAKKDIQNTSSQQRRAEPRFFQTMVLIDKKIRGWGDAFRSTTQRVVFAQMDLKIHILINKFTAWFQHYAKLESPNGRMRMMGIALLIDTPSQDQNGKPLNVASCHKLPVRKEPKGPKASDRPRELLADN